MATVTETTRVRAVAKDIHISPQKVRLVLDQVRGKRVNEALAILRFLPQGAAREVARVVRSAAANAEHNNDMDPDDLIVALCFADEGTKLKRFTARARGRPGPIIKRFSHITVVVEERPQERRRVQRATTPTRRGAAAPTGRGRSQTPIAPRTLSGGTRVTSAATETPETVATVGAPEMAAMPTEATEITAAETVETATLEPRVPAAQHAPGEIEVIEPLTEEEREERAARMAGIEPEAALPPKRTKLRMPVCLNRRVKTVAGAMSDREETWDVKSILLASASASSPTGIPGGLLSGTTRRCCTKTLRCVPS